MPQDRFAAALAGLDAQLAMVFSRRAFNSPDVPFRDMEADTDTHSYDEIKTMAKEPKPNMPWEDAIQLVLSEVDGGLHYADVAERIATKGLRQSLGATPASTVSSYLSTSLRELGDESPYIRVGRGVYALKVTVEKKTQDEIGTPVEDAVQEEAGALRAFGMFWKRDSVYWLGKPQLLGKQGTGASDVNFASQDRRVFFFMIESVLFTLDERLIRSLPA